MSYRSAPWRRSCPEIVGKAIDEALRATIYIVHEAGPTGFVLKQEGEAKKVKVFLGDQHTCSCTTFRKKREVCLHILWILLKKFRIPRENPAVWQLGLIEREINEILLGHLRKQSPVHAAAAWPSDHKALQRDVGPDDVCPICQDELLSQAQKALTFCKYGCGKSVHLKCMKIWADHQKSTGESIIRCPLCRENFGAISEIPSKSSRRVRAEKAFLHLGMACTHCHVCPIAGKCYRCCQCASYYLCHACFSSNQVHLLHPFEVRQHYNQPWHEAERPRESASLIPPSDSPALPPALINSLQSRSLTENDYELLLQLDGVNSASPPQNEEASQHSWGSGHNQRQGVPERVINSFHVEPLDGNHPLIISRDSCQICYNTYSRGDWVRKLPCKHKFHRECIDEWLRSRHITCPIDGLPIYNPSDQRRLLPLQRQQQRQSTTNRRRSRQLAPLSQAAMQLRQDSESSEELVEFTISGQSIIRDSRQTISRKSVRRKTTSGLRRLSGCPLSRAGNHSAYKSAILPKLELNNEVPPAAHPARPVEQREDILLPNIHSSSVDVSLQRKPSDTKRLTIQIPSASGDSLNMTVNSEKQTSANNGIITTTSTLIVKSKAHSAPERLSDYKLLAPTCSSYAGSMLLGQSGRQLTKETLLPLASCRATDAIDVNGRSNIGGEKLELAVLPAISNLSGVSPRFNNDKHFSNISPKGSCLTSSTSGLSRKLRKGSLVTGDKSVKRCISLRESVSELLDTSLQVSSFQLASPQEQHRSTNNVPSVDTCTTIT